jgi:hypothetical protein
MIQKVILEDLLVSSSNYALTTEDVALYKHPSAETIDDPRQMDKLITERCKELAVMIQDDINRNYDDSSSLITYHATKDILINVFSYLSFNKFPFITTFGEGGPACCDWSYSYHRYEHITLTTWDINRLFFIGTSYPVTKYQFGVSITLNQLIAKATTKPNNKLVFPKDIIEWT